MGTPRDRAGSEDRAVPAIHALVLAAGDSVRMGRPKALLDVDGRSAVERCVDVALACGCRGVGVMVATDCEQRVRERLGHHRDCAIYAVPEAERSRGPIGSLTHGLGVLTEDSRQAHLLIWPVDHPFVAATSIAALVRALVGTAAGAIDEVGVVVPRHAGRRGHPILIAAPLVGALRDHAPRAGTTLRDFVRGQIVHEVDLDDPFVRGNADTPDEFEALRRRFRAAFPTR